MSTLHLAAEASASPSNSILPAPSASSMSPFYDSRPPIVIPDGVGIALVVLFACIVTFQFYAALGKSPHELSYKETSPKSKHAAQWKKTHQAVQHTPPRRVNRSNTKTASSARDTPVKTQIPRPSAEDTAEEALFRFTAMNTLNNKRSVDETPLPPLVRPPGARW
ncbi:hypothetical protein B0H17DRAFT_1178502 [Mycena rosella]|uniref:Uncharacterized protein n=1 Tax=Mycena rosella TaxID=1033263 RepID=A0AAD7DMH0_MYCRO|nr:hypothetical protein B0H17DRAFT_1178502 [Mycena rosella]